MLQWWGPDAGPTLSAEADVRPGGRFSVVFRLLNGKQHNPTGVYQEMVPEKKLVFTWEWPGMPERESLVTILLEPVEGGTELTLIHEQLPDEAARDQSRARLERLAQYAFRVSSGSHEGSESIAQEARRRAQRGNRLDNAARA